MKGILGLLRHKSKPEPGEEQLDSLLFTTAFAEHGVDANLLAPWEARAVEVGASRLNPRHGTKLLQGLWAKDKYMRQIDAERRPGAGRQPHRPAGPQAVASAAHRQRPAQR